MAVITKKGEEGFWKTFQDYPVYEEWTGELYNYFMMGFPPGGFHRACFENDLAGAAMRTHHANKWKHIVEMMKWIINNAPNGSWGGTNNVKWWLELSEKERKEVQIAKGWKLTDDELTWKMISEV